MSSDQKAVAEKLLQIDAVKLNIEKPFIWASGWKSPVYCDNRKLLSYPVVRDFVKSELSSVIFTDFPEADAIAGVATAGIAWGAMAADQLRLPFAYVRPKPKDHGLGNQVEGNLNHGQKVVVVEDLVSTGKSSLEVVEVLRKAEVDVAGMVSIFTYGFETAVKAFKSAGIEHKSLTNYATLIELAVEKGIVTSFEQNTLLNWRLDPANWDVI